MFRIHERHGTWSVSRDGDGIVALDGEPISYAMYLRLKDTPHEAANLFRREGNRLVLINSANKQ